MKEDNLLQDMEKMSPNMWKALRKIAKENKVKLFYTFGLVAVENIVFLTYPIFAGISVNAILEGDLLMALSYIPIVFLAWGVGSTRRVVDTRTFARIYAEMAVPVILAQRDKGEDSSTIAARVSLSREFVDFFEIHFPNFVTSVVSVLGAVVMLLIIEFWIGVVAFMVMGIFILFLPKFVESTNKLYFQLNNQLEKEVDYINIATLKDLEHHYGVMARLRISISNKEALSYLGIGLLACILFSFSIIIMTNSDIKDAGHISAVMTYLWMFAISMDDSPRLMEQFSKLKDIGNRVNV